MKNPFAHFYYLANPYRGTEAQQRDRAHAAALASAALLRNHVPVYSPIVHNRTIELVGNFTEEETNTLFLPFDLKMLPAAAGLILLQLEGWEKSYGVGKELELCQAQNIPVYPYTLTALLEDTPTLETLKPQEVPLKA